MSILVTS